jgi:hypothetical protein
MKSGIIDKNGTEIKLGDTLVIPYIDPMGTLTEEADYKVKVVFEHGCFGYYTKTRFKPLFEWQQTEPGTYIPNAGIQRIYTRKYPFWVDNN